MLGFLPVMQVRQIVLKEAETLHLEQAAIIVPHSENKGVMIIATDLIQNIKM